MVGLLSGLSNWKQFGGYIYLGYRFPIAPVDLTATSTLEGYESCLLTLRFIAW